MKLFNYVETKAILVSEQISSNSWKNETIYSLFPYKSHMYIHVNVCKLTTDVKLLLFT